MKTIDRNISELIPADYNPRTLSKKQYQDIKNSLTEFGFVDPVIINMHPDRLNTIIGGHQRVKVWQDMGNETVPCIELSLPLEREKELNVRLNRNTGSWDFDMLANAFEFPKLIEWGFEPGDFGIKPESKEDDFEGDTTTIETNIVRGDLIEIGVHRLLCGDSTIADDVEKVLGGAKPTIMITDPPYGVNYDANWRNEAAKKGHLSYGAKRTGVVSNDDRVDWSAAFVLSPSPVAYIYCAAGDPLIKAGQAILDSGYEIRAGLVWLKSNFPISRGHYTYQHEPIWYAVRKGLKAFWIGSKSESSVWKINLDKNVEGGHSTQKPVECMAHPMRNHEGDVYDPFLGSGTTMVAAHGLNRICYGIEIEPKYCQVIINRMLKLEPGIEIKINGKTYKS